MKKIFIMLAFCTPLIIGGCPIGSFVKAGKGVADDAVRGAAGSADDAARSGAARGAVRGVGGNVPDIIKEVIPDVESSRSNNNNNTDNPDSNSPDTGISQPSPLPIVQNYLDLIRNRNYEPAWDMLPDSMKEDKQLHPNGYQSFYEWYNSISRLDVNDLSILESNTDSAAVKADLHYELSSGRELNFKLKFVLEFDSESRQWQIVAVKKI